MEVFNRQYAENIQNLQTATNAQTIMISMKNLIVLRNTLMTDYPEYLDSITDTDYFIARGAFRIKDVDRFEETIQRHYYDDARFKRLYQLFVNAQTENIWRNVVRVNAKNLEKTFVRSLSVIILTGICISILVRK